MRHRPKRENYPYGKFGDMDYYERLERYCTYLENKLKQYETTQTTETKEEKAI